MEKQRTANCVRGFPVMLIFGPEFHILKFIIDPSNCLLSYLLADSPNWVLFQPNYITDAKLGCLWNVKLRLDSLCNLITDRVKLVELLLNRTNAKLVLLSTVKELLTTQYNGNLLPVIENVFDKLNAVYS